MTRVLKGVCETLKINQLQTSMYHPQTDGLVEHFTQTLKGMIRTCIQGDPKKWDLFIPLLLFAMLEVPQASMVCSLFKLAYGHQPRGLLIVG